MSKESTFASIRSLFDYAFKSYKKGKITLTPSNYDVRSSKKYGDVVYLAPDEEEELRKIQATGCELFIQQLPTTKRDPLKL